MILVTGEQVAELLGTNGFSNGIWHCQDWFCQEGGLDTPVRYYPCTSTGEKIPGPYVELGPEVVVVHASKAGP